MATKTTHAALLAAALCAPLALALPGSAQAEISAGTGLHAGTLEVPLQSPLGDRQVLSVA